MCVRAAMVVKARGLQVIGPGLFRPPEQVARLPPRDVNFRMRGRCVQMSSPWGRRAPLFWRQPENAIPGSAVRRFENAPAGGTLCAPFHDVILSAALLPPPRSR